jgi:hypothetical protein
MLRLSAEELAACREGWILPPHSVGPDSATPYGNIPEARMPKAESRSSRTGALTIKHFVPESFNPARALARSPCHRRSQVAELKHPLRRALLKVQLLEEPEGLESRARGGAEPARATLAGRAKHPAQVTGRKHRSPASSPSGVQRRRAGKSQAAQGPTRFLPRP